MLLISLLPLLHLSALYKEFFTITSSDELPFGWRVVPFSDIAAITMGQSPQGDDCNNDGVGEPLLNGPTEVLLLRHLPCNGQQMVKNIVLRAIYCFVFVAQQPGV